MNSRRQWLQTMAAAATSGAWLSALGTESGSPRWRMPDEAEPHRRTWMAFGASAEIWGARLLPEVQRNLARIALAIARFEPVSMLVRGPDVARARDLTGSAIDLIECPLDDLWLRDTGPVFVTRGPGEKRCVDFNFNGWGNKQAHAQDAGVAAFVGQRAGAAVQSTALVLEGGGIEVDGQGSAIITESCMLNANRNPGLGKAACEATLKALLGLDKIIWLPGVRGKDITDGHTDFYARFASPGVVVAGFDPDPSSFDHAVTQKHLALLSEATDARGKPLKVVVMPGPQNIRPAFESDSFAAGYINFFVCNGAVIAPQFGDSRADGAARETLRDLFPGREIVQINIDGIAAGGGGIHCTTQQEPA